MFAYTARQRLRQVCAVYIVVVDALNMLSRCYLVSTGLQV